MPVEQPGQEWLGNVQEDALFQRADFETARQPVKQRDFAKPARRARRFHVRQQPLLVGGADPHAALQQHINTARQIALVEQPPAGRLAALAGSLQQAILQIGRQMGKPVIG
ncbi:hypothetical protein ALO75_200133 [Pseudomonas syringae pv. coryli]|uniref:Uncharacterized protein n=1 Tax=Pseudomonas syringae pv. coryli TaxID=317659 RepID=A0A0P9NA04_9PSED|nr:hypothetical protein ALO75_200133 [Pseudomonas syringae pv. coryli]